MKSSDVLKKVYGGGNVFRILESTGFVYDPNNHNGALVKVQIEGVGFFEADFTAMSNGDTLRMVFDASTYVYDISGVMTPNSFSAVGIVDFEMLDEAVYATVPSAEAVSALRTPAMQTKIGAIELRQDEEPEKLTNKRLESPMINDANAAQASFDIPLADTSGTLKLTVIEPGTDGNSYTMHIVNGGTNDVQLVGTDIMIVAATGCTCYEMYREIMAHAEIPYLFSLTYLEADADKLVEEVNPGESFTGGVDGYKLESSASEIDLAVTKSPIEGKPNIATAATAMLTSNNTEVTDGDTVTIGDVTYCFKDTPATAYDVKRHGTTADTTMDNLIKAINASGIGDGSDYYAGTEEHPLVSAGTLSAHAFTVTAKIAGIGGNDIAKSTTATTLDWDGTGETLTNGVDGTVAPAGAMLLELDKLWVSVEASTATESNWKYASLT